MKRFEWSDEKNAWLKRVRGIGFEQVIHCIMQGALLDVIDHPNPSRYPGQRIFIIALEGYAYLVPFVEDSDIVFLKTIIPSRKITKRYIGHD